MPLRRLMIWLGARTWRRTAALRIAAGLPVYVCDPRGPSARGTGENNGLLPPTSRKATPIPATAARILSRAWPKASGRSRPSPADGKADAIPFLIGADSAMALRLHAHSHRNPRVHHCHTYSCARTVASAGRAQPPRANSMPD